MNRLLQKQFAENSQKHPVPYRNAVRRLTERLLETGSVLDAERNGRPFKLKDKKLMDISDYAAESIKMIAQVGAR
jgi:phosphoenolpyruvate carboxylase